MANNLTGDFDAVLQVSVRQINGLLATLHQNKPVTNASPTFLHKSMFRVGEEPGDAVRGGVQVQISTPKISLAPGATSQVTAHLFVRARFIPDADTLPMPDPVHGEVRVTYDVVPKTLGTGQPVLDIPYPAQDERIQFSAEPTSGLTAADEALIAAQVRQTLRRSFKPMQVPLPPKFPFFDFKAVGSSPGQALALPLQLGSTAAPAGAIHGINNHFLTDEFSIAVSKEYVGTKLDALISSITKKVSEIVIIIEGAAIYTGQLTSGPTLTWKNGSIELSGAIALVTDSWLPNQSITFKQSILLDWIQPSPYTYYIMLKADGEPDVDESALVPHDIAVTQFKLVRDQALIQGAGPINQVLVGALESLDRGIKAFEPASRARYTGRHVTPDGLILYGMIETKPRTLPVVSIQSMHNCSRYTAFESWIPAGRITNYEWSLFELITIKDDSGEVLITLPFHGKSTPFPSEPHRFVFSPGPAMTPRQSVCLRIDGTQLSPNGIPVDISAFGSTGACSPSKPEYVKVHPPGWEVINLPKWWPDPPFDGILDKSIYAHVDAIANPAALRAGGANHLVHFANWNAENPLAGVLEALGLMRVQGAPLIVEIVLPVGGLNATRREVERKLGFSSHRARQAESAESVPVMFELTEDYLGDWARAFEVERGQATFLLNSQAEPVWRHPGLVDVGKLADALNQYVLPGQLLKYCAIDLVVRPGKRISELYAQDDRGQPIDLEQYKGRRILLNFWQSWSQPSIHELLRLQKLHDRVGADEVTIVGICGDRDPAVIRRIREQHGLTISLAHDVDRRITQQFDVSCWPTTVSISEDRIVHHVQYGLPHSARRTVEV